MPRYHLFGVDLESDHFFANRLGRGKGPADLAFTLGGDPPADIAAVESVFASPDLDPGGSSLLTVHRMGPWYVLRRPGLARFWIGEEAIVAVPDPGAGDPPTADALAEIEIVFLGPVMGLWLERRGVAVLHAAAVALPGGAVLFLGTNRGGKSSLAAAMMDRGATLLADDVVAVESRAEAFLARPSYPQMRFWPAAARHLVDDVEALERVHPRLTKRRLGVGPGGIGHFQETAVPVQAVVLPARRPGAALRVEELAPAEGLMTLLRQSFLPRLVEACGWQARRLDRLGALVEGVGVARLHYPSGYEHLPEVADAVLDWVAEPA